MSKKKLTKLQRRLASASREVNVKTSEDYKDRIHQIIASINPSHVSETEDSIFWSFDDE